MNNYIKNFILADSIPIKLVPNHILNIFKRLVSYE